MKPAIALAALLCTSTVLLARSRWDKPPEQWTKTDALRVLTDSPWSPAKIKVDAEYTYRHTDPATGIATDNPTASPNTPLYGIQLSRHKAEPRFRVLWWSSKAVRSAILRLQQLKFAPNSAAPVGIEPLPDIVLAIEGEDALRIFGDAPEKLRETVFLETADGAIIDLTSVRLINAPDDGFRVEFYFPRERDGHPMIDPTSSRVIFHARASASQPVIGRQNSISLHAEFNPSSMRLHSTPDR